MAGWKYCADTPDQCSLPVPAPVEVMRAGSVVAASFVVSCWWEEGAAVLRLVDVVAAVALVGGGKEGVIR